MPKRKKAKKSKPAKKKAARKPIRKAVKKSSKKTGGKSQAPSKPKSQGPLPLAPKAPPSIPGEKFIGKVEDYFGKISVIALTLKDSLSLGDSVHVLGHTTDFVQELKSMQINHNPVKAAKKGDSVGFKVGEKARKGDNVYRVR